MVSFLLAALVFAPIAGGLVCYPLGRRQREKQDMFVTAVTAAELAMALLAVLIGWIFFNSRSLPDALGFLRALVVSGTGAPDGGAWLLLCLKQYGLQLAVCFVLCTDLGKKLWQTLGGARAGRALRYAVLALVFFLSVLTLTGSGMQAFIYARF